ncbi:MAG: LysR substrate-binding domain-containing protein [Beijerinckiaceae bacterium]|nr:LysR substrate-binding domain-containing protein [Beijerinckiaceae bacterium]
MAHVLDSDQLRTFVAIVDAGSFTKAADVVHKTQSAVSMQIKRLEERIGRPLFERDGRNARLTEDGERVLVRLGVPDDYADRYLPEILARFARSNPQAEVTVVCEPTPNLMERMAAGDLDLAIITHVDRHGSAEIVRVEQLLWVTSARHQVHEEAVVPLALGRPTCAWRLSATEALERSGRAYRVLYASWNSTAVGAAVMAGLAVSVLPESAVRTGMRILGQSDGFPPLTTCRIGLVRALGDPSPLIDALADHIVQSLDNLATLRPAMAAE